MSFWSCCYLWPLLLLPTSYMTFTKLASSITVKIFPEQCLVYLFCWTSTRIKKINPIPMAGGVYDSLNFKQKQLKMAWSKNIFSPRSIPHKMCLIIPCYCFLSTKCCFRRFFNQKVRASTCLWGVSLCISAGWDSYMSPRQPIGVRQGRGGPGGSHRDPPCFLLFVWESNMAPSRTAMHFFIAI
jgi:hypothetical protein